jgi:hypothetical protein
MITTSSIYCSIVNNPSALAVGLGGTEHPPRIQQGLDPHADVLRGAWDGRLGQADAAPLLEPVGPPLAGVADAAGPGGQPLQGRGELAGCNAAWWSKGASPWPQQRQE